MKETVEDLAIFGGRPLFSKTQSTGQLHARPLENFLSIVREAYDARRLTNDGPIVQRLERTCAALHGVPHCIAVTNAGIGISMLLRELAATRNGVEVIVPGFSFRGLPHFIRSAGQTPRFVDVDVNTHTLDVVQVAKAISPDTTAILAVSSVHSFGSRDELVRLAAQRGVPLVFDSVYALGGQYYGRAPGAGGTAEVFSLHATKLINGFDGGYITTTDAQLALRLRSQRNFALGSVAGWSPVAGLNGKLNEIHAAMALAVLPELPRVIDTNRERFLKYKSELADCPGLRLLESNKPEVESSSHVLNVLEVGEPWPYSRNDMLRILRAEGMGVRAHYSPPASRARMNPSDVPSITLPVTDYLAERSLQLPGGDGMSERNVQDFGALCGFLFRHSCDVSAMMAKPYACK